MLADVLPPTINYQPDPEIAIDCVAEGSRAVRPDLRAEECLWFRRLQFVHCI